MKASDLNFKRVNGNNPPPFNCNFCGTNVQELKHDFYMADVRISDDSELSIVACSEDCVKKIKCHPAADQYLKDTISSIKNL